MSSQSDRISKFNLARDKPLRFNQLIAMKVYKILLSVSNFSLSMSFAEIGEHYISKCKQCLALRSYLGRIMSTYFFDKR